MYQLRGQDKNHNDTGECREISTLDEAMEMFIGTNNWWKLSWTRPNGKRVRLLKSEDGNSIEITDPANMK